MVNDVRDLITRLVQNHGFNDGPARYKTIQNYTISLIEGRNPENPGWLATSDSHRVPSQLGENFTQLIAHYFECKEESLIPKYYQVILTTLNIVRMVEGLVDADIESITAKSKPIDQELLNDFEDYVFKTLVDIKPIDSDINLFNIRFNLNRNGPNGIPKIESATQEAVALFDSVLIHPFRIICQELNCQYLYDYLTSLVNSVNKEDLSNSNLQSNDQQTTHLRTLARIPDKGFKTRMVAIVDFWSQLILEPIRAHVQRVIEIKFGKTDFRKDQDLGVSQMVKFQQRCLDRDEIRFNDNIVKLDAKHLYFYDISSWTDRFHRDLQKIVMRKLFSPRLAEAWGQLTVHCNWYYPKLNRTLKYGQGQGMGTNGSFDIATLTDHLYINYILDQSNYKGLFPNNECYGKVGDDLWIYDPDGLIPKFYEKINLPINLSKSKQFVCGNSFAEFCARTFFNATDVSRISPNVISKSKDFRYIPLLLGICSSRGIQLDATSFETLQRKLKGSEVSYLDKLQDWLISYLLISLYEPSSQWKSLDLDYLTAGNWLTSELITEFIKDTKLQCRLLIGYSIITILENKEDLEDKLFDLVDAMDEYSDEITQLCNSDANLFDISNPYYAIALESCQTDILSPKQVIVFGRYVDQRVSIQEKVVDLTSELRFIEDPLDIYKYSKELASLAQKSCYDQGNINYNVDRVIGTQYKILKVLNSFNEDYTILEGIDPQQLRSLWQDLPYDELAEKWEGFMPMLST
jgi:hypothetical protein